MVTVFLAIVGAMWVHSKTGDDLIGGTMFLAILILGAMLTSSKKKGKKGERE